MATLTKELLGTELALRAGPDGGLSPNVLDLMEAEGPWEGRVWDVLRICAQDWERLAYLAGGVLPGEVATWVGFWVDADLSLDQIKLVIAAGGYDPEPFVVLARRGLLDRVLTDDAGAVRRINGEVAGAWISDQFADATDQAIVAWADQVVVPAADATG